MNKVKFGRNQEENDYLAQEVKSGRKTATSFLRSLSQVEVGSELGNEEIVVDGENQPVAKIKITKQVIKKMNEIEEDFAQAEGDGSLRNWRNIHYIFYGEQMERLGKRFGSDTEIVCKWFEVMETY